MRFVYRRTLDGKLIVVVRDATTFDVAQPKPGSENKTCITQQGFDIAFQGRTDPVVIFSRDGESMTFSLRDMLEMPDLIASVLRRLLSEHPSEVTDDSLAEELQRLSDFSFADILAVHRPTRRPRSRDEERASRQIRRRYQKRKRID